MIRFDEHLRDCLGVVRAIAPLDVPLSDALDLVLAEDVAATAPLPGADNSAMDGYAVHAADVAAATADAPVRLPVVADIMAGAGTPSRLQPGAAIRIMTGGVLPDGADAIVPVEDTDAGVSTVLISSAPTPGRYLRRAGDDVLAGEVVLIAGTRLAPRHLALLAAVGRGRVRVRPAPRVVVISTGNEVVEPGAQLQHGQVHDANGIGIAAAAAELGCRAMRVGVVPDDPQSFRAAVEDQLVRADVVITSGGVSMGAFDVVKAVLSRVGTVDFRKVAIQPGMPQGVGVLGDDETPVFCLPGNPVSALVSFEVFVRPALRRAMGESSLHRPTVTARADVGWRSPAGKRQFTRARLRTGPGPGEHGCEPVGGQGSHLVADLAVADALAVVPEDVTEVSPGDEVQCMVLERARR